MQGKKRQRLDKMFKKTDFKLRTVTMTTKKSKKYLKILKVVKVLKKTKENLIRKNIKRKKI